MKKRNKAILIAFVLGDGYIKDNGKTGSLNFCHAKQQEDYLIYKVELLHSLLGGKKPKINEYTCKSNHGNFQQVRATKTHRYFRVLRNWLYPNKYNQKYLKYLNPEALALWYMDDGSCVPNNRYNGEVTSARTNIHICTTKEIADSVCRYFKEVWGIKWTSFKENGGTFSIRCFHKEGKKFHEIIHPYIIPSMKYKQRFYYDTSA